MIPHLVYYQLVIMVLRLVMLHAAPPLAKSIPWDAHKASRSHQAQAQALHRAQTVCGPDAQASLCVV